MHHIPPATDPEPRCRPPLRRGALMTAAALAVAVCVAACGGGASTPGVASGSSITTTANPSAAGSTQATELVAYASCIRSHGVPNFPDPTDSGGIPKDGVIRAFRAVSDSQAEAAQNDCRHLLPAGGSLSGQSSHSVTAQDQQDYLKAAACMRSHGITNFPDPIFSGGTVSFHEPSGIDTHSTQFTRARQTCQKLIPARLPYSGSGG